jgi:hypothetical protein
VEQDLPEGHDTMVQTGWGQCYDKEQRWHFETCKHVVEAVTSQEDDINGVDISVASGIANATAATAVSVGGSVTTADIVGTSVLW